MHYVTTTKAQALGGKVPAYSCKLALSERWIVITSHQEAKQEFFSEVIDFDGGSKAREEAYQKNLGKWGRTGFPRQDTVREIH